MSETLIFNRIDFKNFLDSLSNISDTAVLNLGVDEIHAIAVSADRSMSMAAKMEWIGDTVSTLNLPSLKKLSNSLDLTVGDDIKFTLNSNHLEYVGGAIKFKYHLHGDGILPAPKFTIKKIDSIQYDCEFVVTKEFLTSLLKQATIFKDTKKLYIVTDDGILYWSLGDKVRMNTDVLTIAGGEVDFELDDFIINLDNLRLLSFGKADKCMFRIKTIGIGSILIQNGSVNANYILTSLTC